MITHRFTWLPLDTGFNMDITRRGFLKAVAALTATPVIAKIPDIKAAHKAVKEPPILSAINRSHAVGGLYKDGELAFAFKDWEIMRNQDYFYHGGQRRQRPQLHSWRGSASCLIDNNCLALDVGGEYEAVFIFGEKAKHTGKVFLNSKTISQSVGGLIEVDIDFNGVGEIAIT